MSLPKGVYNKDDCGQLKNKDSDHTRRCKKNTYHVVNENIASSKVTDRRRRKRGCLPGIPKLRIFGVLVLYLGVPWASPSLGSFHVLFYNPSNLYPKVENFTTQNSTGNFISSVSERKQNHNIRYCNELILYLFWC